ncbi:MAG TPA: Crp/Fnr family transcriptional regulator [Bacillota bacterium]|jgi:CRP/FNR family transcriptional regulator|nr:Crp/Fnr family transcriptional regulator [Clostridiales bacterium UBA9856]HOA42823.1 Crp/Fnr family transcriptional regulator [Bacillota bacterium]HPZ59087.1 Crp/Fnr family transcriptional regulator [Bacillota bacterium]HQC82128.1 Crp/Fnr family transcriptional regulator [Bacillota bacterium]
MKPEDLSYIKDVLPFWKSLTGEQKQTLENSITLLRIPEGTIHHGGSDDLDGLFLVKEGRMRAYIVSETGKEITLYRLLERDICIFSASCMLRNISFEILVEAEKDTEAFLIPSSVYQDLLKNSIHVSDYTNQLMSSRFSDVMWIMEQVLFMSFDKRLALFLLEQSNIEGSNRLLITHETIAKHMGTAREVVTRMLKYFAAEGIVELFRGGILLKDTDKLTRMTN